MAGKKDFAKDTLVYGLGTGLKKFIGIFLLPFYTRALTVSDFGILESLGTFAFFISVILTLGLDSASGFYFFKERDPTEKGKILYAVFIIRILSVIPLTIISFFSSSISNLLFGDTKYFWVVFISIHVILVDLIMNEQAHIYRYYKKPWGYNIITIIKALAGIGLGIFLVVIQRRGIIGAQFSSLISSVIVIIVSFFSFTRKKYTYSFNQKQDHALYNYRFNRFWKSDK